MREEEREGGRKNGEGRQKDQRFREELMDVYELGVGGIGSTWFQ